MCWVLYYFVFLLFYFISKLDVLNLNDIKNIEEREQHAILTRKDAIKNINEYNEQLAKAKHTYELFDKVSVKNLMPSSLATRSQAVDDIERLNASLGTEKGRLIAAENILNSISKKRTGIANEENKASSSGIAIAKEKVKAIKLETVSRLGLTETEDSALTKLKMFKEALEKTRDETAKNSSEFESFNESIKDVETAIDYFTKPITVDIDIKTPVSQMKELTDGMNEYLKSFTDKFTNGDFSDTFKILNLLFAIDFLTPVA